MNKEEGYTPEPIIVRPKGFDVNISPDAFHRWATDYLQCKRDFRSPDRFSPVPYFLLCRAIELEIKARHLKHVEQKDVKYKYWHSLIKAYKALDSDEKILSQIEEEALGIASEIYSKKDMEYFNPRDALTAYKRFPDLESLESITSKIIGSWY